MKIFSKLPIIAILVLSLAGCSVSSQPENTDSVALPSNSGAESAAAFTAGEETTTDDHKDDQTNATTEEPADNSVKSVLLKTLWKKMIQRIDSSAPESSVQDAWERSYTVEAILGDFSESTFRYGINMFFPSQTRIAFTLSWPDYITDVAEHYQEADQHLEFWWEGEYSYPDNDWIEKKRENGVLQITGQITSEAYAQANLFLDNMGDATYYVLWGSAMEVASGIYLDQTGSFLGEFAGQIYMESFDFASLTGNFWICVNDMSPVYATMVFENRDCREYTVQLSTADDFTNEDKNNAWLGIIFDLTTEKIAD